MTPQYVPGNWLTTAPMIGCWITPAFPFFRTIGGPGKARPESLANPFPTILGVTIKQSLIRGSRMA